MRELIPTIIVSVILGAIVLLVILKMKKSKGCHGSCGCCSQDCHPNLNQYLNDYKKNKSKV